MTEIWVIGNSCDGQALSPAKNLFGGQIGEGRCLEFLINRLFSLEEARDR